MPATPVVGPIMAIAVLSLLQVPPGVASDRVVVVPGQASREPLMGAGSGFTVCS